LSKEKDGFLHSNHVKNQKGLLVDGRKEDEAKKWILEMKASGRFHYPVGQVYDTTCYSAVLKQRY